MGAFPKMMGLSTVTRYSKTQIEQPHFISDPAWQLEERSGISKMELSIIAQIKQRKEAALSGRFHSRCTYPCRKLRFLALLSQ